MENIKFGFETFEEAEKFAKEHNGDVFSFRKRDGHNYWDIEGRVFEPYDLYQFYDEEGHYYCYRPQYGDEYEYFTEVVKNDVAECECFEDAIKILGYHKQIWEMLSKCGEDEFVVDYGGYIEKMPIRVMRFSYDVYTYEIGVIYYED